MLKGSSRTPVICKINALTMLISEIYNTSAAFMNYDLNESWNYQHGDSKFCAVGKVSLMRDLNTMSASKLMELHFNPSFH